MLLYTKNMELRNGVNCIEPLFNKKSQKLAAVFVPCNFQPEQKWVFEKRTGKEIVNGMLINVATGKCLTFESTTMQVKMHTGSKVKIHKDTKNKMLSFLTKVVKESVEEVQTPYIFNCKKSNNSRTFHSQIWLMGNF